VQRLSEVYAALFGMKEFTIRESASRLILQSDSKVVETNLNSGGLWAADKSQLWRPELTPNLVRDEKAGEQAKRFLYGRGLLPNLEDSPFSIEFSNFGRTLMVSSQDKQPGEPKQLDTQVNYSTILRLDGLELPLVGGGGEFNMTYGDEGRIIGFSGVWRDVQEAGIDSNVIPPEDSLRRFYQLVNQMEVVDVEANLAYYAAPMRASQQFLYPVYVYRARAVFGEERVPLRIITLPATEFGPFPEPGKPLPARDHERFPAAAPIKPPKKPVIIDGFAVVEVTNPYEAGTSWIGLSGGLAGSQNNARGFIDGLIDAGWTRNFNWGDAAAWESDWRREDDRWVDDVDFVFYTGHANMNGWVLSNPDDGFLRFSELGGGPESPGDLWGQQDLEWMIIAACGPLQDEIINPPGGGHVLDRWDGAFDGLHQLLGYGAITYDNEEEGASVIEYARDGDTIIDAWFRTAREIQPSTNGYAGPNGPDIYVGAMYVYRSGVTSPRNDHLWGYGSVAPDPTSPNIQVCMWTTT
jgi:hypothetical protein